jgi:putative ABC transport system ATP-binding protein
MGLSIELKQVGHYFKLKDQQNINLFQQVSLKVMPQSSYAIVGASGSGKSTLLSILAGLESPAVGTVTFRCLAAGTVLDPEQFRRRCGFVFQQFHLLPEFNTLHNVALPLRLRGDKQALSKAADWLDKVGLAQRAQQPVSLLSGGEQQRVAIARAFFTEPRIVFADEPTGNLDLQTAIQVADLMFACSQQAGSSLLLVTHNTELAARADVQCRLQHGTLELSH